MNSSLDDLFADLDFEVLSRFSADFSSAPETLERAAKQDTEELLETRTRHIKISRALQAKAIARLKDLDPNELSPEETRRFLEAGVRIERLVLGEATERFDLGAVARFAERLELMKDEDIILLYQRLLKVS